MVNRIQVGIIGSNSSVSSQKIEDFAELLGTELINKGYRIICGGMGGVMESVCKGARKSLNYHEGDTIGILPSENIEDSNPYVDVVIATGIGYARNQILVASSEILIAIGGGAGTLSEITFAWQMNKPIISVDLEEGWSSRIAGDIIDHRQRRPVAYARDLDDVMAYISEVLPFNRPNSIPQNLLIADKYIVQKNFRNKSNREHYYVKNSETGQNFVLKSHLYKNDSDWKLFQNEISLMKKLNSSHVLEIVSDGEYVDSHEVRRLYSITPLCNLTLEDYDPINQPIEKVLDFYYNLLEAHVFLEDHKIIHRNLNLNNIFVNDKNNAPVLFDFYRSMNCKSMEEYEYNVKREDIYNSSKILIYLLTGEWLLKPTIIPDFTKYHKQTNIDFKSLRKLIFEMTDQNPDCRLGGFHEIMEEFGCIIN